MKLKNYKPEDKTIKKQNLNQRFLTNRSCSLILSAFICLTTLFVFSSDIIAASKLRPPVKGISLLWEDDFKGSAIDPNYWTVYSKDKGWGSEKYRPSQVTVENGICTFTAVKEGNTYWSGGLTNVDKKGVISYGYYEMRAKLPKWTGGQWPAFWLVGCHGNWMPEFDIVDGTNWCDTCFWTNPHWRDAEGKHQQTGVSICPGVEITADYHVYGFLWTKEKCVWYFDGKEVRTWVPDPVIPDCPNPIILNFEMGGWGGRTIVDSTLPWKMKIDWVRVWKLKSDKKSK